MSVLIAFVLGVQFCVAIALFVYVFGIGYGIFYGAPYIGTRNTVARAMMDIGDVGEGDTVLDLGSGLGTLLSVALSERGVRTVIGYEINPLLVLASRLRLSFFASRVSLYRTSILRMRHHPEVTVLFLYVLPGLMDRLLPLLAERLPPNTRIISHGFAFSSIIPVKEVRIHNATLRLYAMSDVIAHVYGRGNHS